MIEDVEIDRMLSGLRAMQMEVLELAPFIWVGTNPHKKSEDFSMSEPEDDRANIEAEKVRYTRFHWAAYGCAPADDELEDAHMLELFRKRGQKPYAGIGPR